MKIHELFQSRVTRDIPPVVYFHEQSPEKLLAEVREYIVTGGWRDDHPNHERVPVGIHEHYVRLLTNIARALDKPGGPDQPASWISGFYGSGKSSFAKLLGLSLDGKTLPDGTPLAEAWIARDTTQRAAELRQAWEALLAKVDPLAVVFDIGGVSRGNEHIHTAVVRQVQARLGYCDKEALVADYELRLERDGHYERFLATAERALGKPWDEVKHTHMVEDDFSLVLHEMFPEKFRDPMDWVNARAGQATAALSAEDAAKAIADMLRLRAAEKTLFIVVDEVSQYIFQDDNRMLALQTLVSALGTRLRGKAWLLATGQQQLDDQNDDNVLGKMKDRFPPALRVHLAATNIRDVVHKRLLQKKAEHEATLRALFQQHRSNLRLFAYGCEEITEEDFVEVYPLLPKHIDLILQITSALRTRSSRSQGDDHAIRGLLQMLGELFRAQGVADMEVGRLITLDLVYEVQGSALDVDVQNTMARILDFCARTGDELAARCAKAVALLELLQRDDGGLCTDAKLVARCLYASVHQGDDEPAVMEALERLRRENLLGYSERTGYKIQSAAGQDWERERRDINVPSDERYELVQEALELLMGDVPRPVLQGRKFPWLALWSTEQGQADQPVKASREEGPITVDFRFVPMEAQDVATWVNRSDETALQGRIVWVAGEFGRVHDAARAYGKSKKMVRRYAAKRELLGPDKRRLLLEEEGREEGLRSELRSTVAEAFMSGRIYFRGSDAAPSEYGARFGDALCGVGTRRLPDVYQHFSPITVGPGELRQICTVPLSGPSRVFYGGELGILDDDAGRIVATCAGPIPTRVFGVIQREQGISGAELLRRFSGPPYGYHANVVKACVAGLLHAGKVRLSTEGGDEITSVADAGVQDLFEKDRGFKGVAIAPAGDPKIKPQDRARIRELFATVFGRQVEPENEAIADLVFQVLPATVSKLREVERALDRLPGRPEAPEALRKLERAFEECMRKRQVEPVVLAVRKNLDVLREGVGLLNAYASELGEEAIDAVRRADEVMRVHLGQLYEVGAVSAEVQDAEREVAEQLRRAQPWRDVAGVEAAVDRIRAAYVEERRRRIGEQARLVEEARERVKALPGVAGLGDDDRHALLRPITAAVRETSEESVAPTLAQLHDGLATRLEEAVRGAEDRLEQIQAERTGEVVVKVTIDVRNREIRSVGDVEGLIEEIRGRLLEALEKGQRVRLRLG